MKSLEEIKSTPNSVIKAEADNDGIGGYYYDRFNNKKLTSYLVTKWDGNIYQ